MKCEMLFLVKITISIHPFLSAQFKLISEVFVVTFPSGAI